MIKAVFERCNLHDAVALHYCNVEGTPRVHVSLHVNDRIRTPYVTTLNRIDLIDQDIQMRKPVSDRRLSIDRTITVPNFLIHLSTRHEPLATQHELITEALRSHAILRIVSDNVHRDIGIDKEHRSGVPS